MSISVRTNSFVWIEDLVRIAEDKASCELYGLLKRPDEKYVTEKAYDNPKFVEDLVGFISKQNKIFLIGILLLRENYRFLVQKQRFQLLHMQQVK